MILRLGWDTMSSTSSGLFCKIAAASENVTPSKLVLFREMRRPPVKSTNHCKILVIGCQKWPNVVSRNDKLHVELSMFYSSYCWCFVPGLIRPSLSAGPSGTMEAMKIPRSSLPVLSSPTITKPETGPERK